MPRLSAAARRVIDAKAGDPDHDYGKPSTCPDCGADTHAAKWMGLQIHLEPHTVPVRHRLGPDRAHSTIKQWHPNPINQWSSLFGERDWREIRFMHYTTCPGRNSATGSTQTKGTK